MLSVVECVAIVVFLGVVYAFFNRRPRNAPPIASVGWPIIGNYIEFAKNPISFMGLCLKKHGPIYTVPMLHKKLTFLMGPEASAPFFKLSDSYMSQPEVYGFMTYVFGKGVVYDAEPKKRVQQMQHMSTALRSHRLKAYVPKIEMECIEFFKQWGDSGEINLLEALSELTILTASRCLHGDDVREQLFAEVSRLFHDLDHGVTPLSFFFPGAPTPAHRTRDRARLEMVKIFSKVIQARRDSHVNSNERTDILQVFIDLKYKDGSILSNEEIVGLLIALLFAGQHTSSITSAWSTFFLMFNQKCLDKVMIEQKDTLGNKSHLDFDDVAKMSYLQDCVKESLRLHPPLIMLMRMCMQDCETSFEGKKYIIPKGDIVVASPAAAGRMESVFKNANEFDPERFNEERAEHKTQFAYLAFGGGMHACMGQQFGLLQVKVILSILFRNFEIESVDKEFPDPDYTAMVVGPKTHLRVRYKKKADAFI